MKVFTAGYEGQSLEGFISQLRAQGVQRLVDVREAPISRKPGFSKSALSAALHVARIEYRHIRALGCPKPIRDAYKLDRDWRRYTDAFMAHLEAQKPAVDEVTTLCSEQPTALLCFEADFNRCHRTYVARAVRERIGASICHITRDATVIDPCQ